MHSLLCDLRHILLAWSTQRFKAVLGVLGIAMFAASVVVAVSAAEGTRAEVMAQIGALGLESIVAEGTPLTQRDAAQLAVHLNHRSVMGKMVRSRDADLFTGHRPLAATLYRIDSRFLDAVRGRVLKGRPLLPSDVAENRRVALVGETLAQTHRLRPGDLLRIGDEAYRVVGILAPLPFLESPVCIPLTRAETAGDATRYTHLIFRLDSPQSVSSLQERLGNYFRGREGVRLSVPLQTYRARMQTQRRFNAIIGVIAVMALLSGSAGILHMLLADISEKTRDIGLLRALGATRGRIIRLYLLQSAALTLLGTLIGLALALLLLQIIAQAVPVHFSYEAVASVFAIALSSALAFGLYPALRASEISPAAALKSY